MVYSTLSLFHSLSLYTFSLPLSFHFFTPSLATLSFSTLIFPLCHFCTHPPCRSTIRSFDALQLIHSPTLSQFHAFTLTFSSFILPHLHSFTLPLFYFTTLLLNFSNSTPQSLQLISLVWNLYICGSNIPCLEYILNTPLRGNIGKWRPPHSKHMVTSIG